MKLKAKKNLILAVLMVAMLFATSAFAQGKVKVVASIFPIGDLVKNVGQDHVDVFVLLPPGASPHTFEPKPSDVARFAKSKIYFKVGAGLEMWADKLEAAAGNENLQVVTMAKGLKLLDGDCDTPCTSKNAPCNSDKKTPCALKGKPHDHHDATHSGGNPHVWLDPVLAKGMVTKIADALARADASNAAIYRKNEKAMQAKLDALNEKIVATTSSFSTKKYVTFHPAFAYFAKRYGLESAGVISLRPGMEPSPKHLAEIVRIIRSLKIRAVFAEPQLSDKAAKVIAAETGSKVIMLDPLGGPNIPGRDSYLKLMEYNLAQMKQAMQ